MELIRNETSGRYTVRLGGEVITNCTMDVDCPGRALCARNQSWSEHPSMCHCTFIVQHEGAICEKVGPYAIAFFLILIVSCLIACFWLVVGLMDLYKMIKWKRFTGDALSTSLVLTICALTIGAIDTAAVSRFVFLWLPIDSEGYKDDRILIGTIGIGLIFFFASLCMLNVSLVWIQIADNTENVRKNKNKTNISRYRNLLLVYYTIFLGLIIMALAMGNVSLTAPITAPGFFFVLVTYLYGGLRMRKMRKAFLQVEGSISFDVKTVSAGHDKHAAVRDSLESIQYAALALSFASFNFIVWVSTWGLLGGNTNTPDKHPFRQIAHAVLWFWAVMGPVAVMHYIHGAIKRKGQAIHSSGASGERIIVLADDPILKASSATPRSPAAHFDDTNNLETGNMPATNPGETSTNPGEHGTTHQIDTGTTNQVDIGVGDTDLGETGVTSEVEAVVVLPEENLAVQALEKSQT